ncbi:MAG: hemolysin III family protein [Vicinamibacteria bacterium]
MVRAGERFNAVSHIVGAGLALAGVVAVVWRAATRGDARSVVACSIYGASLLLLYTSSSLYHSLRGRAKAVFCRLDHSAIYLLIAGTYTPFALVTLRGPRGAWLLGAVWSLAVAGILYETLAAHPRPWIAVPLYVATGWLAILVIGPLARALPTPALILLVLGGVFYTLGVPFYALDKRLGWGHGAFHLWVLAGSVAHFGVVYRYVA